ncbi:MAG: hypothetical protein PHU85_20480 [Phycisphaerae bacterium]|nr:hypothetical protein [Phycisphaerae bacterium]
MARCTKKDGGGKGCIKAPGHTGRCMVREIADAPGVIDSPADVEATEEQQRLVCSLLCLASELGLKCTLHPDGNLVHGVNGRLMLVTPFGYLRPVTMTIGEAIAI